MSAPTFDDYLRFEAAGQRTVAVKLVYVDMAGDLVAGLLLSQIVYWHRPDQETGDSRLSYERDGHLWLRKAYDEWHGECRLTAAQARGAFERLRERGLVETRVWKHNGTPKLHIRVVPEAFMEALLAASPQVRPEMRHSTNGSAPQRTSEMRHSANPLPTEEITEKRGRRLSDIEAVYTAWKDGTGRNGNTRLTKEKREKINARLDEGFTVDQLVVVVTRGWRADPWPERVNQNDLTQLLTHATKVEKFLEMAEQTRPRPPSAITAQLEATRRRLATLPPAPGAPADELAAYRARLNANGAQR